MQETIPDAPQASNGTSVERVKRENTTDRKKQKEKREEKKEKNPPRKKSPRKICIYAIFFVILRKILQL